MKIAIDCRMIGTGGIGTYISSLLPFFLNENQCVLIGRMNDIKQYENYTNTELVECNIETFSIKELLNFPKEITSKINQCQVYYTPYCNIPSGIKIPVFSTIHDVVFLDIPGLAGKIGTIARKWFYNYACKKSKLIFTVSEFSKERIIHHLKTKKPIEITYTAVPEWLESQEKIEKENKILFVGNIKRHKGLHTLLPAFKKAKENGLDAQLVIVGNADKFRTGDDTISKEIQAMPKDYVDFTGRISDEDLNRLYRRCKLLVQPSLYEGFGLPPLEALKAGTNVVLSDIPVFKEIYEKFPVSFFKTEDADDLSQKIMESFDKAKPQDLPDLYSWPKSYEVILKSLKTHAN